MKRFLIIVSNGCLDENQPIEHYMTSSDKDSVREYAEALVEECEGDRAYIFELADFGMVKVISWSSDKTPHVQINQPRRQRHRRWTQKEAMELLETMSAFRNGQTITGTDWDRIGRHFGRTGKAIQNMLWRIEVGKIKVEDLPK